MVNQGTFIIPKKTTLVQCPKCSGKLFVDYEVEVNGGQQKFCISCGFREYAEPLPKVYEQSYRR
jgi:predicted nucleic-acid-binding Zn-ribbon protein